MKEYLRLKDLGIIARQIFHEFAVQGLTYNFDIKTSNLQFCWNLQFLPVYSLFRSLPCNATNLLTVEAYKISVVLNTYGVTWTIALDILNVFWQEWAYFWSSSQNSSHLFVVSYFLIFKCQDLVLNIIYSSWNIKSCYPESVSR